MVSSIRRYSPGRLSLVADQAAMAGLDVVGGGFGVVEQVVSGLHVIPAGEQPRDAPARVGRHGGGDDLDPPVPRRVREHGAGEMGMGPRLRLGVGDDQVQGSDADEFEDPEGGPRQDPGTGGDRGVGVVGGGRGRCLAEVSRRGPWDVAGVGWGIGDAAPPAPPRVWSCEPMPIDGEDGSGGARRHDPGVATLFSEDETHGCNPGGMTRLGTEVNPWPSVLVSQILRRSASGPAGEIPPGRIDREVVLEAGSPAEVSLTLLG